MGSAHFFLIKDLSVFLLQLEARHYGRNTAHCEADGWVVYSKTESNALIKHYSYSSHRLRQFPVTIRVTYELVEKGAPLKRLAASLKSLNARYRKSLPGWKTKRDPGEKTRRRHWRAIQRFLRKHAALIASFKYQSDDQLTEGNQSFNLQIASTPKEQTICVEFIKALVEAYTPEALVRGHREIDKPTIQRNGWIRRFASIHRKRGWSGREIARETQRQLREGTWNQRSKLQYNLSTNTISRIAGFKITPMSQN